MNSTKWKNKALSVCLIVATVATYSMVTLARAEKVSGELLVNGSNLNGVLVNGEAAKSGRSIFSSNSIATAENANATINLGKIGSLNLSPNSQIVLSFSENGINADLLSGTVSVINAPDKVNVRVAGAEVVKLAAGEKATVGASKAQDDDDKDGGSAWFIWAIVFGGAVAGIVLAATSDNNDLQLGGGTTVVSPSR